MIRNLNSADKIIKLTLSASIVLLYLLGIISGPGGVFLVMLASALLAVYVAKIIFELSKKDD